MVRIIGFVLLAVGITLLAFGYHASQSVGEQIVEGVTGRYFNRQAEGRADDQAYDPEARRRLWDLSAQLTGESLPS